MGTVLMLAITITVFTAVSVVILGQLADGDSDLRSDVKIVSDGTVLQMRHAGGEPLRLDDGFVRVTTAAGTTNHPLTSFASQTGDGITWRIGEVLCVSGPSPPCLLDHQLITRATLVVGNQILAGHGEGSGSGGAGSQNDLVVTFEAMSPGQPGTGDPTAFTARVTNVGNAPATPDIRVRFSIDGNLFGETVTGGPLAAGGTFTTTSAAWTATLGNHDLQLWVDPLDAIVEGSEANNQFTQAFQVVAGVADPGFAFEDANGDKTYNAADGDIAIPSADIQDGTYDAGVNGLVIPASVGAIAANDIDFRADDHLVIGAHVTATSGDMKLEAGGDLDVVGRQLRITSSNNNHHLTLTAAAIDVSTSLLETDGGRIELDAVGPLTATGADLDSAHHLYLEGDTLSLASATLSSSAGGDIRLGKSGDEAQSIVATSVDIDSDDQLQFFAIDAIDISSPVGGTTITAQGDIDLGRDALRVGTIDASGAAITSVDKTIDLFAAGDVAFDDATLTAGDHIRIRADLGDISGAGATLDAQKQIRIGDSNGGDPDDVDLSGSTLTSHDDDIVVLSTGDLEASDAQWQSNDDLTFARSAAPATTITLDDGSFESTASHIQLWATGVVQAKGTELQAKKHIHIGGAGDEGASFVGTDMVADSADTDVRIYTTGDVDLRRADVQAKKHISIGRDPVPAGDIRLVDARLDAEDEDIDLYGAGLLNATRLVASAGDQMRLSNQGAGGGDIIVEEAVLTGGNWIRAWMLAGTTIYVDDADLSGATPDFEVCQNAVPTIDGTPASGTVGC